ncbi:PqqD family protein [Qipengyuania sp. 1NDH17]|uniref:PqqD family protein n=1 Tax=Qipengyuania polymorpha TaxID=2867234 RepID=A0ABS7J2D2_9SPHN|nr:PqqD family protein [Qipengyuania polymorpha]MBX7458651.1 PqqD family protein [Qipengyuania polymorpha]
MGAIRKLTDNFIATEVDGELLIVDLDGGELFSLSGTAKAVWDAIDGTRNADAIAALMAERHRGDPAVIAADVKALVGQFESAALVERTAPC